MIATITRSQFSDAFRDMGRADQFSYQGLTALFNYLTKLENDCDMQIELDVIGLCCDYCEYGNINEALEGYNMKNIDELRDHTPIIELDNGGIIIQAF